MRTKVTKSRPLGHFNCFAANIATIITEAIAKRMRRNVPGFAPASYAMRAKMGLTPKHAADNATKSTPIKRSKSAPKISKEEPSFDIPPAS